MRLLKKAGGGRPLGAAECFGEGWRGPIEATQGASGCGHHRRPPGGPGGGRSPLELCTAPGPLDTRVSVPGGRRDGRGWSGSITETLCEYAGTSHLEAALGQISAEIHSNEDT